MKHTRISLELDRVDIKTIIRRLYSNNLNGLPIWENNIKLLYADTLGYIYQNGVPSIDSDYLRQETTETNKRILSLTQSLINFLENS